MSFVDEVPRHGSVTIPGARLDDDNAAFDAVTDQAKSDTLHVVRASTNDVQNTRTEDLLNTRYKEKSGASSAVKSASANAQKG